MLTQRGDVRLQTRSAGTSLPVCETVFELDALFDQPPRCLFGTREACATWSIKNPLVPFHGPIASVSPLRSGSVALLTCPKKYHPPPTAWRATWLQCIVTGCAGCAASGWKLGGFRMRGIRRAKLGTASSHG